MRREEEERGCEIQVDRMWEERGGEKERRYLIRERRESNAKEQQEIEKEKIEEEEKAAEKEEKKTKEEKKEKTEEKEKDRCQGIR